MSKFFKFTDFFRQITGRDFDRPRLFSRAVGRERKRHGFLSDRKLKLEELERRELLSVTNVVLRDAVDLDNKLEYDSETTVWTCGSRSIETDTLIILQDAKGQARLLVNTEADGGNYSWGIDGNEAFLSQYWSKISGTTADGDITVWTGTDDRTADGNLLAAPKRDFTFYVWEDVEAEGNTAGVLDAGEDYKVFNVSIQRAEISICVDQPVPGTNEAFGENYDTGHGFWDNRASAAILQSGILGDDLVDDDLDLRGYANKSASFGASKWDIEEIIAQIAKTGTYVCDGVFVVDNGASSLTNWNRVNVYNTFVIDSLSKYIDLLEYSKDFADDTPEYVLMTANGHDENQCMTAALGALNAAGITTGLTGSGANFEYDMSEETLMVPSVGVLNYVGTSPAQIGEALARTDAPQARKAVRSTFNGNYFVDFDYPQPDENGIYSLTELRLFYNLIQNAHLSDTDPLRAALEDFVMNLSSYAQSDNVIYMDFDGHETALAVDDEPVNIITPRYSLDGDETRTYFTCDELVNMFQAWLVTAEDFAPFNVNVTLSQARYQEAQAKKPSGNFFQRVAIGGTCDDWYAAGILEKPSSGVSDPYSYTPPENVTDDPTCFVFANAMRGITIGNTASHEVGHNLGLGHQGTKTGREYYPGANDWSPIMGEATGSLVQWAKGEYPQADNQQDALAIIAGNFIDDDHPTGYRPDDYAGWNKNDGVTIGDIYTATYIDLAALDTGVTSYGGVIETNTDADYFMFEITEEGESYYINVGGIAGITNLDVQVNVYYACGDLLRSVDPLDSYSAGFIFDEAPGVYYISVMGTGRETSVDGVYSDYGSLGMYDIRISKPQIFNVTTLADDGSEGSLRSAIERANAVDRSVDVKIEFDVAGTFTLENGPLMIARSMTLKAVGQNIVISGGEKSSVFVIDQGATDVQFYGIAVTGGIGTKVPYGPEAGDIIVGGGIIVNGGNLTMIDCVISGNKTGEYVTTVTEETDPETGEVISTTETTEFVVSGFGGGAVINGGSLVLTNTIVSNNESFTGGGLYNLGGSVAVYGGAISNNKAQEAGAGVFIDSGTFKVNDPTDWEYYDKDATTAFANNTLLNLDFTDTANEFYYARHAESFGNARGGAIHVSTGSALLNHVTVSGNKVSGWFSQGAGLYVNAGGSAAVNDSTFSNNASLAESIRAYDVSGAGVYVNYGGSATLTRTSVTGNKALSSYVPATVLDADGNEAPDYQPEEGDPPFPTTVEDAGGAGLYVDGRLDLVDSTVTNNVIQIKTTLSARPDGNGSGPRVAGAGIGGLGGTVTVTQSAISGNTIDIYEEVDPVTSLIGGAGIGLASGSLTVTGSTVKNNAIVDHRTYVPEEGAENEPTAQEIAARRLGLGGGIATMGAAVTVTDSTISGNTAATGAGIAVRTNRLTLTGSTVDANDGALYGGGLYLDGVTATMAGSKISKNAAIGHGGGIYAINACAISITESSYIQNNSVTSEALAFGDLAGGGGIWMEGGSLTVKLSYIENNSAKSITDNYSGTDEFPNRIVGGGAALLNVKASFEMAFIEKNSLLVETFDHSTDTSVFADGGGIFANGANILTMSNTRVIGNSVTAYAAPSDVAVGIIHGGGIAAENANIDSTTFTANELYGQIWNETESNWDVEKIDLMANGGGFYGNGIITNSLFTQNNTTGISILNECNAVGAAISSANTRNNPYFPWDGALTVNNTTITENMSKELFVTWASRVQLKAAMAAGTPFDRIRNMPVYGTYFSSPGAVYSSNGGKNMVFNNNIAIRNGEDDNSYLWADYYSAMYRGQYMEIMISDEKRSPVYAQAQAYKEANPDASNESVLAYLENYTILALTEKEVYDSYSDLNYYIRTDGQGNIIERSYFEGWNNLTSTYQTTWFGSSLAHNTFRYDTSLPAASDYSGNNVYYDPVRDIGNYISNKAYYTETVLDPQGKIIGYNVWNDSNKTTQLVGYLPDSKRHNVYGAQYIDYDSSYNAQIDSYNYFGVHTYTQQVGTRDVLDEYGNTALEYLGTYGGEDYYYAYIRNISNAEYDLDADPRGYKDEENYYQNEEDKCYYKIDAAGEKTDEMVLLCKTVKDKEVYYEITLTRYYGEVDDYYYYDFYYDVAGDPLNYLGTHNYVESGNYIVDETTQRQVLYHQYSALYDVYYQVVTGFVREAYNYTLFKNAGVFNFQYPDLRAAVAGNYCLNEWYCDSAYVDYLVEYPYNPATMSGWTETEYNNYYAALSRYNYAIDTGKNDKALGRDEEATVEEEKNPPLEYDLNHAERIVNGETRRGTVVDRGAYEWQHDPGYGDPTNETSIFVTTLADVVADDGVISLREAIANYLAQSEYFFNMGKSITFADYILGGTITLTGGALLIDDSIRIDGGMGGADGFGMRKIGINLIGTGGAVFMLEGDGVEISLTSLDISGGTGYAMNQESTDPKQYVLAGGAIYSVANNSVINITGCEIHDSGLLGHDTIHKSNCEGKAYGGLIYQKSNDATTLNIVCSSLHDGRIDHAMEAYGGAIYGFQAVVNLFGTDVTNNSIMEIHQGGYGGAIALIDSLDGEEIKSFLSVKTHVHGSNIKASTISGNTVSVGIQYNEEYDNVNMKAYGGGIYVKAQQSASTATPRVLLEGAYVTDNAVIATTLDTDTEFQTGNATASGGGVYLDIFDDQGFKPPVDDSADLCVKAYVGKYSALYGKYVEQLTPDDYKIAGGISNNSATAKTSVGRVAEASGGGISSSFACVRLEGGTVSGNSVSATNTNWGEANAYGGGLANVNASILITTGLAFKYSDYNYVIDSLIDSNQAQAVGNARAFAAGGGIYNNLSTTPCKSFWGSSVTMDHTIVSENSLSARSDSSAIVQGGGIYTGGALDFAEVVYDNIYWQDKEKYAQPFNVKIIDNSAEAHGLNTNYKTDAYTAEAYGGGIYYDTRQSDNASVQEEITLKDILVYGNALNVRSDTNNIKASGGGVYSANSSTVVQLTDSSISGNTITAACPLQQAPDASGQDKVYYPKVEIYGAGLYTEGGLDLYQSRACVNKATGSITRNPVNYTFGGGIYNSGDVISLERGRFLNNEIQGMIASGGGIYNDPASDNGKNFTLNVTASFIGGNKARGVYAYGGGLYNKSMSVEFTRDNYSANDYINAVNGLPAASFGKTGLPADSPNRVSRVYGNSVSIQSIPASDSHTAGGGVYSAESDSLQVTGGTFVYGNSASTNGGGVWTNTVEEVTVDENSKIFNNTAGYYGGGLFNSGTGTGTITLTNVEMYGNKAEKSAGGAVYNGPAFTYSKGTTTQSGKGSNLSATNVFVHNNQAGTYGGGFYIDYSTKTFIADSVFVQNSAVMRGGAIYNNTNSLEIVWTKLIENKATGDNGYGGALCNLGNTETLVADSYFTQNTAQGAGGAIYNFSNKGMKITQTNFDQNKATGSYGYGGAIYNLRGNLTLEGMVPVYHEDDTTEEVVDGFYEGNSFTGNSARMNGGAIFNEIGIVTVTDYSFIENQSGADGGAIYNQNGTIILVSTPNSRPLIPSAFFFTNKALKDGGAIYNLGGLVDVSGYHFLANEARRNAGAIYNAGKNDDGDSLKLTGFGSFSGNSAGNDGGAIYVTVGKVTVQNYDFDSNEALKDGGAIWLGNGSGGLTLLGEIVYSDKEVTLSEITSISKFWKNSADKSGGAIYNQGAAQIIVNDYSFEENTADANGGAIYTLGNLQMTLNDTNYAAAGENLGLVRNTARGYGGALYVKGDVTLTHYNVIGNEANYDGGGIYINKLDTTLKINSKSGGLNKGDIDNRYEISENKAGGSGGGVYLLGDDYSIYYCNIDKNTSRSGGGGIFAIGKTGGENLLSYCEVSYNQAAGAGGGIYNGGQSSDQNLTFAGAELILENVLVSDNVVSGSGALGGGIYQNTLDGMTVYDSTIAGNYGVGSLNNGGGVYVNTGKAEFINSIIAINTATLGDDLALRSATWDDDVDPLTAEIPVASIKASNSVTSKVSSALVDDWAENDNWWYDESNQGEEVAPLFVNPGDGDYHLVTGSIAIDKGLKEKAPELIYDLDGEERGMDRDGNIIDSGAYEYIGDESGKYQYVYGQQRTVTVNAGESFVAEIEHKVSTPLENNGEVIPFVTTLSLRIHYDSSYMSFDLNSAYAKNFNTDTSEIVAGVYPNDNVVTDGMTPYTIYTDDDDFDGDSKTDTYVLISWNTSILDKFYWTKEDAFYTYAQSIVSAGFTVNDNDELAGSSSKINFTASDHTNYYKFYTQSIIVSIIAQNFDVDNNGVVDMATDVNLILRYFREGMRGDALRDNLLNEFTQRGNNKEKPNDLETYLEKNKAIFDIGGDGAFTIGVDDVLLERYFAGYRGEDLIEGITLAGTRQTAEEITAYIAQYDINDDLTFTEDKYQVITAGNESGEINAVVGQSVTVAASHELDTESGTQSRLEATTLSLRVHYDSEILTFDAAGTKIGDQYLIDLIKAGEVFCVDSDDTRNFDGDVLTDRYIRITWNEAKTTWWQGNSPMKKLLAFNFMVNSETSAGLKMDETRTAIRFTAADLSAGYQFRGPDGGSTSSVTVNLESGNFDIDNDALVNVSQDGNLFLRRVISSDVWGDDITSGISDPDKREETIAYIIEHIDNGAIFDIDGDGKTDVRDANILVRYLSAGWNDHRLVDGLLDDRSTRVVRESIGGISYINYDKSGEKIAEYIEQFIPDGKSVRKTLEKVDSLSVQTVADESIAGPSALVSDTRIALKWDTVDGADFYKIGYRLAGDIEKDWTYVKTTSNVTEYALDNLKAESRYEIRIQACGNDQNVVSSFPFALDGMNAPTTVMVNTEASVVVSTPNTGSFTVTYSEKQQADPFRQIEYTLDGEEAQYADTDTVSDLLEGEYTVRVRTGQIIDGVYYLSEWGPTATVTVEIDRVDAPVIESIEVNGSQATVTLESIPVGADGFVWQYRKVGETAWGDEETTSETAFTIYTLSANTEYEFRVKSDSSDTEKFDSVWISGTFSTNSAPFTLNPAYDETAGFGLNVQWNPITGATSYNVVVSKNADTNPDTPGAEDKQKTVTDTSVSVYGLDADTIYYVWVQAAADGMTGEWANAWQKTQLAKVEHFGVKAVDNEAVITKTSVTLLWDAVENAESYTIRYRENGSTGDWSEIETNEPGTEYTLTDLTEATRYDVSIVAHRGDSRYDSPAASAQVMTAAAVSNLQATEIAGSSVTVTWDCQYAGSSDVAYRLADTEDWTVVSVENALTGTVIGLTPGIDYEFRVRGGNQIDGVRYLSAWSKTIVVATGAAAPSSFEGAEAEVAASGETGAVVSLTWGALADAVSYTVVWNTTDTWPTDEANTKTVDAAEARIDGLVFEQDYYFKVRGNFSDATHSDWSDSKQVTTGIESPNEIDAVIKSDSLELTWNVVADATGYDVRYREVDLTDWTTLSVNAVELLIEHLNANTAYEVQIRAKDADENVSAWKAYEAGTSAAAVTDLIASTVSSSAINVSWIDDTVKPATSYTVCWSQTDSRPTELSSDNSFNVTAKRVKVTGLESATKYYFWVRANVTADGSDSPQNATWTGSASATTKMAAPSFSIEGFAADQIAPEVAAMLLFANATVPGFEIVSGNTEALCVDAPIVDELAAGLADQAVAVVLEANEFDPLTDEWDDSEDEPNDGEIFTDEFLAELI